MMHFGRLALSVLTLTGGALLVTACSPSFGGGGSPSREVIILPAGSPIPPGASVRCVDGRTPPC
ncbi:hypothetical protein [Roseococcus pinisoli]|uniref:Lipoprotein n=1 Tax=Roseococcus pinisoli TaxID=2835040 RepID=A0ABS5QBA2_9PROT|nr:hypothetical protein [Roseococcus pinisoli]MBS7810974.1 hypothetical protein [Roseococcus pinisoli]